MHNNKHHEESYHDIQAEGLASRISPEFVYLTIPAKYACVYHKLLVYMADFGKSLIDDCTVTCKGSGKNIINCWAMFQSACANYQLGRKKEADFLVNYISEQLNLIYKGTGEKVYTGVHRVTISPDGHVKAILTCGSEIDFHVDMENGVLLDEHHPTERLEINEKGELIRKTMNVK